MTGWRPAPELTASPFGIYTPNDPGFPPSTPYSPHPQSPAPPAANACHAPGVN